MNMTHVAATKMVHAAQALAGVKVGGPVPAVVNDFAHDFARNGVVSVQEAAETLATFLKKGAN